MNIVQKWLFRRDLGRNYAFVVVAIIFVSLLASAGQRSAAGVLILPLEQAFGWSRSEISFGAAVGLFLYGLVGPFAAALMQSFGLRRTLVCALLLMGMATGASSMMTQSWHFVLAWGIASGLGSGCIATVLSATIVGRWFATHRGTVMGLLTASTATGTLIFLPALAALAEADGWRAVVLTLSASSFLLIPFILLLLPEWPGDVGLVPYGAAQDRPAMPPQPRRDPVKAAVGCLFRAVRVPTFWLLAGTFFICGFTANGLVGTHLIAFCADHGIAEVQAAGLLAMMGIFDLIGTTGSGWLSDRFDPRKLLFVYYAVRGLSLLYLPFSDFSLYGLSIFAVFYGLDWVATVPPTLRLTIAAFGDRDGPIVFGWIVAGHQAGAASAAFLAGLLRVVEGRYLEAFLIAGLAGLFAAGLALVIRPVAAADAA
jgi:predicted MFS family arabinose efflux permease